MYNFNELLLSKFYILTKFLLTDSSSTDGTIDIDPLKEYVLSKITPILGILAFFGVLGIGLYIAGFWMKYAFADEDVKEELKQKWGKSWKGLLISGIVCSGAATLLMVIGKVFGVDINLS